MRLSLNKNSLKQQRDQLKLYERFLPSLDLKRQQLLGAWKESRERLAEAEQKIEVYRKSLDQMLPLLGSSTLQRRDLSSLVRVEEVLIEEENVVGARVPVVRRIEFQRSEYSTLTLPFWIDQLVESLENLAKLRIQHQVQQARVNRLGAAARKITQRVNLFEKVLIPTANDNIKKIRIAMSDEERSAVVRSKLAKKKHRTQ
ncbi:MAG: V-type ATP synthase subunit D [Rubripirellula sp.]